MEQTRVNCLRKSSLRCWTYKQQHYAEARVCTEHGTLMHQSWLHQHPLVATYCSVCKYAQ